MYATFDLAEHPPTVRRINGEAITLAWGTLILLVTNAEAEALQAQLAEALGE